MRRPSKSSGMPSHGHSSSRCHVMVSYLSEMIPAPDRLDERFPYIGGLAAYHRRSADRDGQRLTGSSVQENFAARVCRVFARLPDASEINRTGPAIELYLSRFIAPILMIRYSRVGLSSCRDHRSTKRKRAQLGDAAEKGEASRRRRRCGAVRPVGTRTHADRPSLSSRLHAPVRQQRDPHRRADQHLRSAGSPGSRPDIWRSHRCPVLPGNGAQKRTRTSTALRPPAPEAGASTNSAIWARGAESSR